MDIEVGAAVPVTDVPEVWVMWEERIESLKLFSDFKGELKDF